MNHRILISLKAVAFAAIIALCFVCVLPAAAQHQYRDSAAVHISTAARLQQLLQRHGCLGEYRSQQRGPMLRPDGKGGEVADSSFRVERISIPSGDISINGWLYLPLSGGPFPLIVLTNGGGNDTTRIKSLSDWLAPILSHCGIAAFVHDKRGTGASGGVFRNTRYDDYITDAISCVRHLRKRPDIDSSRIGVAGGSEGGRIAVIAAARCPEVCFVISYAGTVVSAVDDRINAQKGWLQSMNLSDTAYSEILALWGKSIRAWAAGRQSAHDSVNEEILKMREKYDQGLIPFTKAEMDSIPDFDVILPTWNSLGADYMSEMKTFGTQWLAIFGADDRVVPTAASVDNIVKYMTESGHDQYEIVVIPHCGHAPVSSVTGNLVRIDNIILNWMDENILKK